MQESKSYSRQSRNLSPKTVNSRFPLEVIKEINGDISKGSITGRSDNIYNESFEMPKNQQSSIEKKSDIKERMISKNNSISQKDSIGKATILTSLIVDANIKMQSNFTTLSNVEIKYHKDEDYVDVSNKGGSTNCNFEKAEKISKSSPGRNKSNIKYRHKKQDGSKDINESWKNMAITTFINEHRLLHAGDSNFKF